MRPRGGRNNLTSRFVRRAGLARFTTCACALGLSLSAVTGSHPGIALAGLAVSLIGTLAGLAWSRSRLRPARGFSLLVASTLLVGLLGGYLGGNIRVLDLTDSALRPRIGDIVEAELVITGPVQSHGGWESATAEVLRVGGGSGLDAADPAVGETVLLEVARDEGTPGSSLDQGLIVTFRGSIEAPQGPTASGFDQARRLLHQGIAVVLRANGGDALGVIGRRAGVSGWFDRLRSSARAHLSRGPDARLDEVLQGVVMGDTAGIDEGWLEAFRRSGTAHMLSVSGLHVASLAAIMIGLARLARAPRGAGFLLAAASALMMIPFVGASPPIVRSAVMIVIVLVGRWIGRGRDQWQVLALAAVVILALNPFALFDVGFQLSFAAFAGMVALISPVQRLLKRLPGAIASNMAVSIAATVGTAPVSLLVFGRLSLISPLANLLVVPVLPVITGLGLAAIIVGFVWGGLSTGLDFLASLPMSWTVLVSRMFAVAPILATADLGRAALGAGMGVALLPPSLALLGYVVNTPFGLSLPLFRRSVRWVCAHRPRRRGLAATVAGAVLVGGLVLGGAVYPSLAQGLDSLRMVVPGNGWPDKTEVRVLDIGQGNAVLVRTAGHHALLFDGGPAGCELGDKLRSLGVRKLDLLVISHPHADHFAGLLEAVDSLDVGMLVDHTQVLARAGPAAGYEADAGAADHAEAIQYLELRRRLAAEGCRYLLAADGSTVTADGVVTRFYAPSHPLAMVDGVRPWSERGAAPSGDELNAASLVAVVSVGAIDVLLPGDAEAAILERYTLPAVEAVVVPHHGSRDAVSERIVATLGARAAFISVGENNYFGHPSGDTVTALERSIPIVLRTDESGWISCTINGNEMVITTERKQSR